MYNKDTVKKTLASLVGKARKENIMDEIMTDYQFQTILKMVLEILKNSKDLPEATEKIENLLNTEKK